MIIGPKSRVTHADTCVFVCSSYTSFNQKNQDSLVPPPAPPLKAQISPLANMFNPEPRSPLTTSTDRNSGTGGWNPTPMCLKTQMSSPSPFNIILNGWPASNMCSLCLADPKSVTRPRQHRRIPPVPLGVAVVRSQPEQKVSRQDHLSSHGWHQSHTPQLWRRRHHHSADSGREGRLAVRRVGENTAVSGNCYHFP